MQFNLGIQVQMMRAGPACGFKGKLSPDLLGRDSERGDEVAASRREAAPEAT